jgi:hypothetical protein
MPLVLVGENHRFNYIIEKLLSNAFVRNRLTSNYTYVAVECYHLPDLTEWALNDEDLVDLRVEDIK